MGTAIADQDEQIQQIAQDTGAPADLVREQYMQTMRTLAADASVHDYLSLFVTRRVLAAFRQRRTPTREALSLAYSPLIIPTNACAARRIHSRARSASNWMRAKACVMPEASMVMTWAPCCTR